MNIDRAVLALAGTMTLVGTLLAATISPWFLLLTGFVGLNQLQASLTGKCPAAALMRRLGMQPGCAFGSPGPGPHAGGHGAASLAADAR